MCLIRVRPEIEEDVPVARARSRAQSRQTARSRPTSTVIIAPPVPPPDYGQPATSQIITAYPTSASPYAPSPYAPSIIDAAPPPNVTLSPVGGHPGASVTIVTTDRRQSRRYSSSNSSRSSSTDSKRHTVASPRQSVISTRSREYHGGSFYPQGSHLSIGYEGDKGGRRRANTVNGYGPRRSLNVVGNGQQHGRSSHRSVRSYGGESDFGADFGPIGRRSRDEKIVVMDEYGQRIGEYVR